MFAEDAFRRVQSMEQEVDKWVMEAVATFDLSTAQEAQKEKEQLVADFNIVSEMATELKVELSKRVSGAKPRMLESSTVQGRTRLPKITHREFDADNPSLWFLELELRLEASGVAEELPRFTLLTGLLTKDQALSIAQVTESVSKNTCLNPYTKGQSSSAEKICHPLVQINIQGIQCTKGQWFET